MPCNSDHMEATGAEIRTTRAAKLYSYVRKELGLPADSVADDNNKYYPDTKQEDYLTYRLCAAIREMDADTRERIVYNGHNATSRDLAEWWERHQEADRKREADAQTEKEKAELKKTALAKLTPAERQALGFK